MPKAFNVLILVLTAAGPATNGSATQEPEATARVRVFNQVGDTVRFHHNKSCYDKASMRGLISKGFQASNGWSRLRENKTVGMPVAVDTPEKFNEYVVPANEPITIEGMHIVSGYTGQGSYTGSCGPIGRYFTPQVGADYEAYITSDKTHCGLEIRQLLTEQGPVTTRSVHVVPAFPCRR